MVIITTETDHYIVFAEQEGVKKILQDNGYCSKDIITDVNSIREKQMEYWPRNKVLILEVRIVDPRPVTTVQSWEI